MSLNAVAFAPSDSPAKQEDLSTSSLAADNSLLIPFELNASGYIPQISTNFARWAKPLVVAILESGRLSEGPLAAEFAKQLPKFDINRRPRSFEKYLGEVLRATQSELSIYKLSDSLTGLQNLLATCLAEPSRDCNLASAVMPAADRSGKEELNNDPRLSDYLNRVRRVVLSFCDSGAFRDPNLMRQVVDLVPMARMVPINCIKRHLKNALVSASMNLGLEKQREIADAIEKVSENYKPEVSPVRLRVRRPFSPVIVERSAAAEEVKTETNGAEKEKVNRTRRPRAKRVKIDAVPDSPEFALEKAQELASGIFDTGLVYEAVSDLRSRFVETVPGIKEETGNRHFRRHVEACLRKEYPKLDVESKKAIIAKLTDMLADAEKKLHKRQGTTRGLLNISYIVPAKFGSEIIAAGTPVYEPFGHNFVGKDAYEKLGLKVGSIPRFPRSLTVDLLNSECPFVPGRRIVDTHILVLIPEKLNDKPLTIGSALSGMEIPYSYGYQGNEAEDQNGAHLFCAGSRFVRDNPGQSYWALIPMQLSEKTEVPGYTRITPREAFIAGAAYSLSAQKEIFYGIPGVTNQEFNDSGKHRLITVVVFGGENKGIMNINTMDPEDIGKSRFFRDGYAFTRALV